ncbi:hypothetical protein TNCV_4528411 [Trichonephila clavipes]|nr:hypothetical protein TNCV_4528411 [Trichonephila clavipes]
MLAKLQFVIGEKNRRKLEQYCANSSGETLENRQTAKQSNRCTIKLIMRFIFGLPRKDGPIIQEKAIQLNKLMNGDAY